MNDRHINRFCHLDGDALAIMQTAHEKFQLSGRGYDRILRVARTIADLAGSENIQKNHISEAIQYRGLGEKILFLSYRRLLNTTVEKSCDNLCQTI